MCSRLGCPGGVPAALSPFVSPLSPLVFLHICSKQGSLAWNGSCRLVSFALLSSRACWAGLSRDSLALPLSPHLFLHTLAGLDAVTRWSGSVSSDLFFICLPTYFLTRLLGWMLSRDGLARSALSIDLFFICLPTCFLTRLLGWMLSQDGGSLLAALSPLVSLPLSPLVSCQRIPLTSSDGFLPLSPFLSPCLPFSPPVSRSRSDGFLPLCRPSLPCLPSYVLQGGWRFVSPCLPP